MWSRKHSPRARGTPSARPVSGHPRGSADGPKRHKCLSHKPIGPRAHAPPTQAELSLAMIAYPYGKAAQAKALVAELVRKPGAAANSRSRPSGGSRRRRARLGGRRRGRRSGYRGPPPPLPPCRRTPCPYSLSPAAVARSSTRIRSEEHPRLCARTHESTKKKRRGQVQAWRTARGRVFELGSHLRQARHGGSR